MVDVDPASAGVDVQVRRRLIGQRVGDSRVAPLVIVVCRRPQEAGSYRSVLPQEIWGETDHQSQQGDTTANAKLMPMSVTARGHYC